MKDYPYVPGWRHNKENNKPAIKHSVLMFTTHGIAEGEWVGNEWVQYRWSCKVKDIEVLYWMHLEDLTQLEKEGDCFQQEQPEVQNGKFVFPKYLYARTKDNKTIDMSYAPQDMTAVEYIRNDFVEQEQQEVDEPEYGPYARQYPKSEVSKKHPEVDFEKELDQWRYKHFAGKRDEHYSGEYLERSSQLDIARHFYELGRTAK